MTKEKQTYWIKLAAVAIGAFANPAFVMLLWNWLQPQIAESMPQIGYWQSCAIYLLSSFLFKSGSK
jgi:hypothetical protein